MTTARSVLLVAVVCGAGLASLAAAEEPRCHERPGTIGYAGIVTAHEVEGDQGRARVVEAKPGFPGAAAGFAAGDVVVAIDGHPLAPDRYERVHAAGIHRAGDTLEYTVLRDDELVTLEVTLVEPPDGWQERYTEHLQHLAAEQRAEGLARLERLTAQGAVALTFQRDRRCRFHAEAEGRPLARPLTLAAALHLVPLLERLRPGDAVTLEIEVSATAQNIERLDLPAYLTERDVLQAIQQSVRQSRAAFQ